MKRGGSGMTLDEQILMVLDAYGVPAGLTIQDRLHGWEQRERRLRHLAWRATRVGDYKKPEQYVDDISKLARVILDYEREDA